MPTIALPDRTVIGVSGADAEHLLQTIVTADLDSLAAGEAKPCALLTPQGKILFDFLIARDGKDGFLIDVRKDVADDLARRLMLYRLRAKAQIAVQEHRLVSVRWHSDSDASRGESADAVDMDPAGEALVLRDRRFPAVEVERVIGEASEAPANADAWTSLRIANGVAESGADYALGDAFPHDVLLEQNGGVGFRKGCYVGQEVVSRMHHRGTARRRILIAEAEQALPEPGTAITIGGRLAGHLGSAEGTHGLALVRVDKVADAMRTGAEIVADSVPLRFSIPPAMSFTFPDEAGGQETP